MPDVQRTTGHAWVPPLEDDARCAECGVERGSAAWAEPCPAIEGWRPMMVLDARKADETVCLRCGSVVGEVDMHDEWHRNLGWGK